MLAAIGGGTEVSVLGAAATLPAAWAVGSAVAACAGAPGGRAPMVRRARAAWGAKGLEPVQATGVSGGLV